MAFAVGDVVDVIDLRDSTIIETSTTITKLYQDIPLGFDLPRTFAELSCGYAVPIRCLKLSGKK